MGPPEPPDGPRTSSAPPAANDSGPPPIFPEFRQGSLLWRIGGMVRTMRPEQWVKNTFVLAPVVFARQIHEPTIIRALGAFGVFCLLAGAVYTMNDLVDVEADRVHPKKRFRPIASGRVPVGVAKILIVLLVITSLGGALLGPREFFATAVAYLLLQVAYSFKLKKIAYVDVSCISLGFVLRVLAGSFVSGRLAFGHAVLFVAPAVQMVLMRIWRDRGGPTDADCVRLTWLGVAMLATYQMWLLVGLPGAGGV